MRTPPPRLEALVWNVLDLVLLHREQHVGIGLRQVDVSHSLPLRLLDAPFASYPVSRKNPTALVLIGQLFAKGHQGTI